MTSRAFFSDLGGHLDVAIGLPVTAWNAGTDTGTGVDRAGLSGDGPLYSSAAVVVTTGAATGTPTSFTITVSIEDSPDNTNWTAYASSVVVASTVNSAAMGNVDLRGADRYVRVSAVTAFVGGTTPTVLHGAAFVFVDEKKRP